MAAYGRALAAPDGGASLAAAVALGRLQLRAGWLQAVLAKGAPGQRAARTRLLALQRQLAAWQAAAPSAALLRLQARAWQRLSMLDLLHGKPALARAALAPMAAHLQAAQRLAPLPNSDPAALHAALLAMAVALMRGHRAAARVLAADLGPACSRLAASESADAWALLAPTELALYTAVADGRLASATPALLKALDAVHGQDDSMAVWAAEREHLSWFFGVAPLLAGTAERDAASRLMQRVQRHAAPATR